MGYQIKDTYFDFKFNIPSNESENIQNEQIKATTRQIELNNILNVAAQIGDKKALQLICECLDIDYEEVSSMVGADSTEIPVDDAMSMLEDSAEDTAEEDNEEDTEQGISTEEEETQNAVLKMLEDLLNEV